MVKNSIILGSPLKKFRFFPEVAIFSERGEWPEFTELPEYDKPPERVSGRELRVSFVGHATVLIQTGGYNFLFDPVWSHRVSPVSWAGPKRVHPPGVKFEDLPPIDVVLISHNHYDHLDLKTVERLWESHSPRIIVPLGNDAIIKSYNGDIKVEAYDWADTVAITDTISVSLEPMHHWSARGLFDRNKALWAAFVLTVDGENIYLVGDTGYGGGDYFRQAKAKYGAFRFALLPIGDYDPAWFMSYGHMSPAECVRAFEDLGKPFVLPIHYNTFPLADTGYGVPLKDLAGVVKGVGAAAERIRVIPMGQSWNVE